jgi:4-coumarate--CoA ligase
MLSGRAMLATAVRAGHVEEDIGVMIGVLPFFHILATMIFHVTIQRGFALVVLPRFEPESFLRAIQQYEIPLLSLAPPIVQFMAKHPIVDKFDLSKTKYIGTGGSALPLDVEVLVQKRLGITVMQGYGMTEFAGPVAYPTTTHFRPGSTGRLMPNTDLKVKCLDTDAELGVNQVGELLFRTPAAMNGYFKNPEANKEAFVEDGFVRTGDVGYIDEDGYVYIVDRLKEMIKYKGHQVSPIELDDVLSSHPDVDEACCVRGQDPHSKEEIPKAFVVRHEGSNVTADELIAYVASKVAGYKRVREVEFIDAIPKSLSGKSLRKDLQARENEKLKRGNSHL